MGKALAEADSAFELLDDAHRNAGIIGRDGVEPVGIGAAADRVTGEVDHGGQQIAVGILDPQDPDVRIDRAEG